MNPKKCGGKPCVAGTRIRVWDVHVWHDLQGQSPGEIVAAFPQLSLADVHAALAYYLDHRNEIDCQMKEADFVAQLRAQAVRPYLIESELRMPKTIRFHLDEHVHPAIAAGSHPV